MDEERELPVGRLSRWTRLARVGARTGLSLSGQGDGAAAAEQAVELLGQLRGLAAKVGQMASYVDGLVPEGQSDAYARALTRLQTATPASPFSRVQDLIERELGGSLERHFAHFEPKPLASASIGQVHRARLHDGREVAVKVQHPGIAEAMENDLGGVGGIARMLSMLGPKAMNTQQIAHEISTRFREELDYRHEASRQEAFRRAHANDPHVHIPRIIEPLSTARVMTSELVHGMSFERAVRCSASLRRRYAEVMWAFSFRSIVCAGMFNADPHPGNFLFHEDGRVTFLDFGCIQPVSPQYLSALPIIHEAAMAHDEGRFREAVRAGLETRQGPYEDALHGYLWRCFEPVRYSPYTIRRDYVVNVVRGVQEMKSAMLRLRSGATPIPPGVVLLNRLQFGFYSVLARLEVEVDYAAVERGILAQANAHRRALQPTET